MVVAVDTVGAEAMAAETATVMSMEANDAMATGEEEEVLEAIGAAEARPDTVATEGAAAMTTAAVATTTTSRHTVFKARWLSIFLCLLASTH